MLRKSPVGVQIEAASPVRIICSAVCRLHRPSRSWKWMRMSSSDSSRGRHITTDDHHLSASASKWSQISWSSGCSKFSFRYVKGGRGRGYAPLLHPSYLWRPGGALSIGIPVRPIVHGLSDPGSPHPLLFLRNCGGTTTNIVENCVGVRNETLAL